MQCYKFFKIIYGKGANIRAGLFPISRIVKSTFLAVQSSHLKKNSLFCIPDIVGDNFIDIRRLHLADDSNWISEFNIEGFKIIEEYHTYADTATL